MQSLRFNSMSKKSVFFQHFEGYNRTERGFLHTAMEN